MSSSQESVDSMLPIKSSSLLVRDMIAKARAETAAGAPEQRYQQSTPAEVHLTGGQHQIDPPAASSAVAPPGFGGIGMSSSSDRETSAFFPMNLFSKQESSTCKYEHVGGQCGPDSTVGRASDVSGVVGILKAGVDPVGVAAPVVEVSGGIKANHEGVGVSCCIFWGAIVLF